MKKIYVENLVKNGILLVALLFCYPFIKASFDEKVGSLDPSLSGDLLVAVSIIAVTACFGNFAFTYERVLASNRAARFFAHLTTGLLMLVLGLSLAMAAILSERLVGSVPFLSATLILLYVASVFYDFWDVQRVGFED